MELSKESTFEKDSVRPSVCVCVCVCVCACDVCVCTCDQVVDVLEGPRGLAVSVDCDVFSLQCLLDSLTHSLSLSLSLSLSRSRSLSLSLTHTYTHK